MIEMIFLLTFIVLFILVTCVSLWPAHFLSLAEKVATFFVELFMKQPRLLYRRPKRVSFAKSLVTAAAPGANGNQQVVSILRVKRGPISFTERQEITRNDFEISNILGRPMPREYKSTSYGNNMNVWAHNCFVYKNCPRREFFDSFIFRQHFRGGYTVNNSGLETVLEEFSEDDEANAQNEHSNLAIDQDDEKCRPTVFSEDDHFNGWNDARNDEDFLEDNECPGLDTDQDDEDCRPTVSSEDDYINDRDTTCKKEGRVDLDEDDVSEIVKPPPITLRRSPRLAKLAKSLTPQQPPRRSERLRKKPRVDYSVFF